MKVAVGQFNPTIGAIDSRVIELIKKAKAQGADLLILPELTIPGYPPRDLLDSKVFINRNLDYLKSIEKAAVGITVLCGFVDKNPTKQGPPLSNAAAVLQNGQRVATYHKRLLPNYDVFDEERYFEPGNCSLIIDVKGKRVGVTICEDLWTVEGFEKRVYPVEPLEDLIHDKLDLILNLSGSPFHLGKPQRRVQLFGEVAERAGATLVYCNQVGGNDELIFDGCSFVVSPKGKLLLRSPAFGESLDIVDLENPAYVAAEWPDSDEAWLSQALKLGLRDYVEKCNASQVCLGLSGGIDSAVCVVLAAEALGKENVKVLALPSRFTANVSTTDAEQLAKNLGVEYGVVAIEEIYNLYQSVWKQAFGKDPQSLTLENLQPRIRMTILMALANEENRLLLNTSNKSEIATGYSTLYGDSTGALSVLGDLTKTQVYQLARYMNRNGEIIPTNIIDRPPTAELKKDQTDQDSLPPYDILDPIVIQVIEHKKGESELIEAGFEEKWVKLFFRLYRGSEYKRYQLPPVLRVSQRAFGMGRRIPIAAKR